jgi:hypothetical protein
MSGTLKLLDAGLRDAYRSAHAACSPDGRDVSIRLRLRTWGSGTNAARFGRPATQRGVQPAAVKARRELVLRDNPASNVRSRWLGRRFSWRCGPRRGNWKTCLNIPAATRPAREDTRTDVLRGRHSGRAFCRRNSRACESPVATARSGARSCMRPCDWRPTRPLDSPEHRLKPKRQTPASVRVSSHFCLETRTDAGVSRQKRPDPGRLSGNWFRRVAPAIARKMRRS